MKLSIQYKKIGVCSIALLLMLCFKVEILGYAQDSQITSAKESIVEVQSGFTVNGIFYQMQSASGFLAENQEGNQAYIVTSYTVVQNTEQEKQEYYKQNGFDADTDTDGTAQSMSENLEDTIRIVVNGVAKEIENTPQTNIQQTVCILQTNGIGEAKTLPLGESGDISTGKTVYVLDYNGKITKGQIQASCENQNQSMYFQHSVNMTISNIGSPIIDEEGYVLGVNTLEGYALAVDEVRTVLDTASIPYTSRKMITIKNTVNQLLEECKEKAANTEYKQESREKLLQVTEEIENFLADTELTQEEMEDAQERLIQARNQLEIKMKTSQKFIYGFLILILIMFIWLFMVFFLNEGIQRRQKEELQAIQEKIWAEEKTYREWKNLYHSESYKNRQSAAFIHHDTLNLDETQLTSIRAFIRCLRTEREMFIDAPEVMIGKQQEGNDFVIADNPVISRKHAKIVRKGSQYYICDLGSSNGTFVNNKPVGQHMYVELHHQDMILLANEKIAFEKEGGI